MTIDCVYFTPEIRCFRDGHIERMLKGGCRLGKKGDWIVCKLKPDKKNGYLRIEIDKKTYKVHRVLGFCFLGLDLDDPLLTIDHIYHDRSDNRVSELRIATRQQQSFNKKKTKGYYWNKEHNKWKAVIEVDDKKNHLGYFDKEEDARAAYLAAKEIHHIF